MISLVLLARCAADRFTKKIRIVKKRHLPHPLTFNGSFRSFHLGLGPALGKIAHHGRNYRLGKHSEILADFRNLSSPSMVRNSTENIHRGHGVSEVMFRRKTHRRIQKGSPLRCNNLFNMIVKSLNFRFRQRRPTSRLHISKRKSLSAL